MKCIKCKIGDTEVKDSRHVDNGFQINRKRVCINCKYRFFTFESTLNPVAYKESRRKRYAQYRIKHADKRKAQQREYQSARRAAVALGITISEVRELWKKG